MHIKLNPPSKVLASNQTVKQGHKPIPPDVFGVAETHAVVGYKNWPRFSEKDVLQAVNGLDQRFCQDFDRVRQIDIVNFFINIPCNNHNKSKPNSLISNFLNNTPFVYLV